MIAGSERLGLRTRFKIAKEPAMRHEVMFVKASVDNPSINEIREVWRDMAEQGLALVSAVPCTGIGDQGSECTVGVWLFFSEPVVQDMAAHASWKEEDATQHPSAMPKRWSP